MSLLALSRAGAEEAKTWFRWRRRAHGATLLIGLLALFCPESWMYVPYVLGVLVLVGQVAAWWINYRGTQAHGDSESARRRAILVEGLGATLEPLDVIDVRQLFDEKTTKRARELEDAHYYASTQEPGVARLRELLQESAFWSKHLYAKAAGRSTRSVIVLVLGVVLAGLVALPLTSGNALLLAARVVVVFLGFLVGVDELSRALSWRTAASQTEAIDRRLESGGATELEPLLAIFGDYCVVTSSGAPIPTAVYEDQVPRLNALWKKRVDG